MVSNRSSFCASFLVYRLWFSWHHLFLYNISFWLMWVNYHGYRPFSFFVYKLRLIMPLICPFSRWDMKLESYKVNIIMLTWSQLLTAVTFLLTRSVFTKDIYFYKSFKHNLVTCGIEVTHILSFNWIWTVNT